MSGPLSNWFEKQGVQGGEWFGEAKAFAKRAQRASNLSSHAYRVLFNLRLHTIAYRSEKAVKQVGNRLLPLTPHDIAVETGLERQKVRDALAEIEQEGYGERKAADDGRLRKGAVEIYCWAVPHEPRVRIVPAAGYKISPDVRLAAHLCGIEIPRGFVPPAGYNSFLEIAFSEYKEAVKVPQERLKQAFFVAPGAPTYKDDRKSLKERTERIKAEAAPQPVCIEIPNGQPSTVGGSAVKVNSSTEEPADRLPYPANVTPNLSSELQALAAVVEEVATPVIGESPTALQYLQIHERLKGASLEQYSSRLEAKKRTGKLNSVGVLAYLADDCAKTKDTWKPPVDVQPGRNKSFKESVMGEAVNRLARSGNI